LNKRAHQRQVIAWMDDELIAAIDAHRGEQTRTDWLIAAARERLSRQRPLLERALRSARQAEREDGVRW
jgi:predicted restriction endonuclease